MPNILRHLFSATLLISLLAACASAPPTSQRPDASDDIYPAPEASPQRAPVQGPRRYVLNQAMEMLGTPYRYGGTSPRGFDCSGLVYYSHQKAGISVPRTARAQRRQSRSVPSHALTPGDLVFFRLSGRRINHVGIYTGDGKFIHAPSSGKRVSIASLENPYWQKHLVGAGNFY